MLKVGWVSASPVAQTGYGKETREIGYRLVDLGVVDMTFIGSFGVDIVVWGGVMEQETPKGNKATILTLTDPRSAPEVLHGYARKYELDLLIGFMDCFGLEFLNNVKIPSIGYIPIDGPFTGKMRDFMRNYHRIISYSKFGYRELQKWYPPSKVEHISHGISTDIFKPLNAEEYDEAREWFQKVHGVSKDAFLAIEMAANVGPRKLLPLLMQTFSHFARDREAHLFIFTNAYSPGRGYDLISHRINLKMENKIHFPIYDPILHPVSDEELRMTFGAADVFVHNAVAEGFGLPLVEAMGCGVPPIAPDNSAQTENVMGHGWLVESIEPDDFIDFPVYVPTLQQYPIPSQKSLLQCLISAYDSPDLRKKYGNMSRDFVVQNYSWNDLMPKWIELLEKIEEEFELFREIGKVMGKPA